MPALIRMQNQIVNLVRQLLKSTFQHICDLLKVRMHSKLQGQTQFKLNEAENLSAMLGMTMSERDACFFDTQNRYERSLAAAERRKPK